MAAAPAPVSVETASWDALRATLVVMPVFVVALTNPALYLPAVIKTTMLGQQACSTTARSAGRNWWAPPSWAQSWLRWPGSP
jgi:hypothetical protein